MNYGVSKQYTLTQNARRNYHLNKSKTSNQNKEQKRQKVPTGKGHARNRKGAERR